MQVPRVLTFQQHRHQRRAVAVLRLLHQQLAVLEDHGHRVAPADDPVHDIAGVVLLIGAVRLDRKERDTSAGSTLLWVYFFGRRNAKNLRV